MQPSHTPAAVSVRFDDPNLVSDSGVLPAVSLAQAAGLQALGDEHMSVPTDKGAHEGLKITSLVTGMVAGADSINDMSVLRHGGIKKLFTHLCPLHAGIVPAQVHLRPCPRTRRGRLPVPDCAGRAVLAAGKTPGNHPRARGMP